MQHLVVDIGNFRVKGAIFKDGKIQETFALASQAMSKMSLRSIFTGKKWDAAMIASVNDEAEKEIRALLGSQKRPYFFLNHKELSLSLDVDEPDAVGADRIANCYGALVHFPKTDSIIIDIGTAVTFDYITKERKYLGGAIYPGMDISAKALNSYTKRLPLVTIEKPPSPLARTTVTHIQAGIYYGMLGTTERIIKEMKAAAPKSKEIKTILTGGGTTIDDPASCNAKVVFVEDFQTIVDFVDPHLTLLGLHEILRKEYLTRKEK